MAPKELQISTRKQCAYHLEYQLVEDDSISSETHDRIHRKTTWYPEIQKKNTKNTERRQHQSQNQ